LIPLPTCTKNPHAEDFVMGCDDVDCAGERLCRAVASAFGALGPGERRAFCPWRGVFFKNPLM
jgi:hypothetical protein